MKRVILYLLLIGLPIALAAWGAEFWLWHKSADRLQEIAARHGIAYDPRSKAEVVRALRQQGKRAHLYVPPETLFRSQGAGFVPALRSADGKSYLQPLGSISRSENVVCNESGAWFRFTTDRHGFNNPDAVWDREKLDVLALGDSFSLGNCVPQGTAMVDLVRRDFPATLNLGAGGNGPLIQLAALREYGARYRPRLVLWFFYPNDLQNLAREEVNIVLDFYRTNPEFSQRLVQRQDEIDTGLSAVIDAALDGAAARESKWLRMLRLQKLRHILLASQTADVGGLVDRYRLILKMAGERTRSWGGQPVFIYLPQPMRWYFPDSRPVKEANALRKDLLSAAARFGFETIDLTPALDSGENPKRFAYDPATHYSEAGYKAAADIIIPRIRAILSAGPVR